MKKIGILTFYWANDLGAMLQAYALKECLNKQGFDASIIPYSKKEFTGRYLLWPYMSTDGKTCGFKGVGQYSMFKANLKNMDVFYKKKRRMADFRRHFLTDKTPKSDSKRLGLEKYDAILVGSDQVWNPELTIGLDDVYFGNFDKKQNCRVISYAASFGKESLSENEGPALGRLLDENFYAVSLREKSAVPFTQKVTKKKVVDMPDPTLLCTRENWLELSKRSECSIGERYFIYHSTQENNAMKEFASKLSKQTGLKMIDIRRDIPAGPLEFLSLMSKAECVVTNSFHGTVFSILLERPMAVFAHKDKNARLSDLMDNLGLSDRLGFNHEVEDILKPIDWEKVREQLEFQRNKGIDFLKTTIGGNADFE